MANPPVDVQQYGQSIWYDNIQRSLIDSGELRRMIEDDGVLGVTSNPTIFEKAISSGTEYDEIIKRLLFNASEVPTASNIYERLAIADIQAALDLFRPVYEDTDGRDGFVSLEVSPLLARDTAGTLAEAKRLNAAVNRPNLMIKIPATPEGIPAIEEAIFAGLNVNVTLIFSVKNYEQVAEAYLRGLERRLTAGLDVSRVASVASFFLSRIDTMIDRILENNIRAAQGRDIGRVSANSRLLGKAAIANAKAAYKRFLKLFNGERFGKLRAAGARVQRPLWASTSTKNPAYPDTLYIDSLIGRDTVNTVPPAALKAFKDHGTVGDTLKDDLDAADSVFDMLAEVGVDIGQITQQLQDDGVDAFRESFESLLARVEAKCTVLMTGVMARQRPALGTYSDSVQTALKDLETGHVNARMWSRDGSVWKDHGPTIAKIEQRLGWLFVRDALDVARLKAFQAAVKGKYTHAVLLGMGGSSLAPEVLSRVFGSAEGFPELLVLDSTVPARVLDVTRAIRLDSTLFIVASKSGSTIEVWSFYRYFWELTNHNGAQFIAITDPGSLLEQTARENGFADVFLNPADIGGRYSALSYFGMVPAALLGIDLERFWREAEQMIAACSENVPAGQHPGMWLGAIMAELARQGRDKLTLYASSSIISFGDWAEQLVAESTGKEGKGIVPIVGGVVARPHEFASDRLFVYLKVLDEDNSELDAGVKALREAGFPRLTLELPDKYALAGEFFRWEYATAVAGKLMGINPFDEPNVTEAKEATARLLNHYREHGGLPVTHPVISEAGVELYADSTTLRQLQELIRSHGFDGGTITGLLEAQINGSKSGDYFAFLVYLNPTPEMTATLNEIRRGLRGASRRGITLGYGPRYLHSTGQLHKGGPNNGIYVQFTSVVHEDVAIPGEAYSFGALQAAQAAGDLEALQAKHRRTLRLHFTGSVREGLKMLFSAIERATERRG